MGTKSEALARQFEAKAQEAVAVLEKLSAADWMKVTEAGQRPPRRSVAYMTSSWRRAGPSSRTPRR